MREQGYILPKSYRKIGFGFFILAIVAFTSVFYLIWAKVVIILTPNTEPVSQEMVFNIKEGAVVPSLADGDEIPGKVRLVTVDGSGVFEATGSKAVDSNVVGEVTITNNYSKDQTLVETARLSAPEDPDTVLVRLNKTVVVPAGQSVQVQVYPDDPENFKSLEPMKFVIPGLWGPLQDKIYAENSEVLSLGGRAISVVIESDFIGAEENLKEQLYQKALSDINQELDQQETLWPKLVSHKVVSLDYNAEVGEETSEFTATMKLEAVIIVFDESRLISAARNKLREILPSDKQLLDLDPKNFSYAVENYNLGAGEATIKATLAGSSILANTSELFSKDNLTGLTEEEVKSYFSQFPEVNSVEVKFQPAWLKKTPRLKDKIQIEIAK